MTTKQRFCEKCSEPIRFSITTNGKPIALDVSSDPAGVYEMVRINGEVRARFVPLVERPMAEHTGTLLFLPHQSTCDPRGIPPSEDHKTKIHQILKKAKEK